ncbi:hypothetical protein HY772_03130 [Candidatus Woesearchaeota archaeon]|nr:hypothetical protein [Candidatus Woesearchaeota archaeon]
MKSSIKVSFVGKVDRAQIMKAITVASKLIKSPRRLEIYAVESPQKFDLVLRRLPRATQNLVKHSFSLKKISFSTQVMGRNIIIIVLHRAALKDPDAMVGLLLHEMTHIVQQYQGLADGINRALQEAFISKVARLRHPRFSTDELVKAFVELGLVSTLLLKDLYATTELIDRGYENYVIAHYRSRFSDKKLCPAPINPRILHRLVRRDLRMLVSVARFEAYVAAVLLPLRRTDAKNARNLRAFIEDCYSTQVNECEKHCLPLIKLYTKEFSHSAAFCKKFFNIMFARFVKMLG